MLTHQPTYLFRFRRFGCHQTTWSIQPEWKRISVEWYFSFTSNHEDENYYNLNAIFDSFQKTPLKRYNEKK